MDPLSAVGLATALAELGNKLWRIKKDAGRVGEVDNRLDEYDMLLQQMTVTSQALVQQFEQAAEQGAQLAAQVAALQQQLEAQQADMVRLSQQLASTQTALQVISGQQTVWVRQQRWLWRLASASAVLALFALAWPWLR